MGWLWLTFAVAAPVDRVLFVVGERIVTQSDAVFETFFDAHDHPPIPRLEDPSAPVELRLRDIAVIRQVAGDTSVFRPTDADVRARADAVLATWPRPEEGLVALAAWGMDEQAFLGFVYSRLVVERCVARNVGLPPGPEGPEAWALRYVAWVEAQRARVDLREPPKDPG